MGKVIVESSTETDWAEFVSDERARLVWLDEKVFGGDQDSES